MNAINPMNPIKRRSALQPKTYLACIGTRPEIIKMAPVYRELKACGHKVVVVHTGQHAAIAQPLYTFFEMPPDATIELQRKSPSLVHLTAALLDGIVEPMLALKPDVIMVQGDTSSALVGAMLGYYHDMPVAHIEAGLRTGERDPFPEEKNREIIARLTHWHFPPTPQCTENLLSEGIRPDRIFEVGNTVIDAALWARARISRPSFELAPFLPPNLREFLQQHPGKRLILITAHRRENWGDPIRNIARAVGEIIRTHKDTIVVWPVHPNPAVGTVVHGVVDALSVDVRERICMTTPLAYQALISLLGSCEFTLTDSGGIQEEASAFGKPVLVARESTERQELVNAGGAILVGTDVAAMIINSGKLLTDKALYRSMQLDSSPFGDGQSARRIVDTITSGEPAFSRDADMYFPLPNQRSSDNHPTVAS